MQRGAYDEDFPHSMSSRHNSLPRLWSPFSFRPLLIYNMICGGSFPAVIESRLLRNSQGEIVAGGPQLGTLEAVGNLPCLFSFSVQQRSVYARVGPKGNRKPNTRRWRWGHSSRAYPLTRPHQSGTLTSESARRFTKPIVRVHTRP